MNILVMSGDSDATLKFKVAINYNRRFFVHMTNGSTCEWLFSPNLHSYLVADYKSSSWITSNQVRLTSLESCYNSTTVCLVDVSFRNALRFVQITNFTFLVGIS
jgi:hypothetical protein